MSEKVDESPEIYALKHEGGGWNLSRRDFLKTAVAAGAAAAMIGKGGRAHAQDASMLCADGAFAHRGFVGALAFSPDGSILASGSDDKSVKLWSMPSGGLIKTCSKHEKAVMDLAWSPDGKTLASCSYDRTITLWAAPAGKARTSFKSPYISPIAMSPDGSFLAAGGSDESILLLSLPSGKQKAKFPGQGSLSAIAISADGKLLAASQSGRDIGLWSLPDGAPLATLKGHQYLVRFLSISRDGSILASAGQDGTLRLWSLPGGEPLNTFKGPAGSDYRAVLTPDGRGVVTANYKGSIELRSVPDLKLVAFAFFKSYSSELSVDSMAINPDGTKLALGMSDSSIKLYSLPSLVPAGCLTDADSSYSSVKLARYKAKDERGVSTLVSVPCGSPIPAGSACVCDCVAGSIAGNPPSPSSDSGSGSGSSSTHYWHPN